LQSTGQRVAQGEEAAGAGAGAAVAFAEGQAGVLAAGFRDTQASIDRDLTSAQIAGADEASITAGRRTGYSALAQQIGDALGIADVFNIPEGFADNLTQAQKDLFDMMQGLLVAIADNTAETASNTAPDLIGDRARSFIDVSRRGFVEGNAFAAMGLDQMNFANPDAVQRMALAGASSNPAQSLLDVNQQQLKALMAIVGILKEGPQGDSMSEAQIINIIDRYFRDAV
jgi:hypothetical protein